MAAPTEKPAEMAVEVNHGQENSNNSSSKAETEGHAFNEQTNYVPKRTIITVCEGCTLVEGYRRKNVADRRHLDLPGMLYRRPDSPNGPDDSCSQSVYYRECIGCQ